MAGIAATLKTKALAKQGSDALTALQGGNLKGVGNTRIQATWGTSKTQSNSSSVTEVNQGSNIDTNNLALIATGAGADSNININGSNLTVSNDALFQADNDLNVNGVAQNSNTRSNNQSSSTAIGGYASFGQNTSAGITASASRGKGYANSDSTTYANSQINVGGNTTLDIGNDLNIKGGVLNTDKIQGVIGGDMTIESLQDTATYDSDQKNMGFSADLDLAKGTGSSLSVNGGKTNLNSDYKAVGEQSGIFANEADLITQGKGTFKGGVFVTSKEAQANSNIVFKQGVTATDLKNTASYDGDAIQAGISIGSTNNKPQASMNGIGYGTDSDSDSSITKGGVSGHNDPQGIFTTENREALAGKLENNFDAGQVNEELGAQTQITQAFDQERRKVKTEINTKEKKLRDEAEEQGQLGNTTARDKLIEQADKVQNQGLLFDAISGAIYGPNSNGATGYVAKVASPFVSNQIGQYYKEQSETQGDSLTGSQQAGHILAHGILGAAVSYVTGNDAVTGGVSAGAGEATAPVLSKFLYGSSDPTKLTAEQKDTISAITSALGAGIGATTGNASDAANAAETSKVAVEDNYYYADLKNISKKTKQEVEKIYNIQKSSFEGKCRSAGGDCNDVIDKMLNFVENPYVKKNYVNLRGQTLAKLKSNPELIITYLDSENFKLNKADQSVLNTQLKPILQATGGGFGVVGSIGGTVYACAQTAGLGCYAAAIAGSAGATSSFDHIKTGFNNYGKPLSQQSSGDLIKNLKGLGFTDKGARNIQLAADILGTGGLGYSVAANKAVNTTSKYATSSTNVAKKTVSEVRYNNPQVYREQLAKEANIPKHIDFKNDVKTLAKLDSQELRTYFEINGYNTSKPASRASGNAEVYNISNHETVQAVQYSPVNPKSTHRGEYRKITYKDGRMFKFIDTSNHYLPDNKLSKNTTYFNREGQRIIYNFDKKTWSIQ